MKNRAIWITAPVDTNEAADTFKKEFSLKSGKAVKRATLYASAMGVYLPYLNGERVGCGVLTPGWTAYKMRVQYQSYDITALLREKNEISIGLGQGWAVSNIGLSRERYYYADRKALIAWIDVVYTDGTRETVATDESWSVYTSEVVYSEIYHGETVDKTAKIKKLGYATPASVRSRLIRQVGEWITEQERISPIALIKTPRGECVIDFGQNMTGYVEVRIKAERGSRILIHHAEVLDKDGNFYTENYRSAKNENLYITSGENDVFKPSYTFQGFRYIRLSEFPTDEIDLGSFTAIAVNSDIKRTGKYHTGNAKINQLYHNIIWGQKSNYLDVPTDCPQRDERLGWTGDAQVFCRTAAINFDVERFFRKWLGDVALEQKRFEGAIPSFVPDTAEEKRRISAAWGDVACIAPWQIYLAYGNKKLLRKNFPMMRAWVDYLVSAGPEKYLWIGGVHYGDWLGMDAGEDSYMGATSHDLIASAFFAYSTSLLIKAGEVLGEDVTYYREVYKKVRAAFRDYFMKDGMPKEDIDPPKPPYDTDFKDKFRKGMTQTAISLILYFGLCEECERAPLAKKLAELVLGFGGRMATGFVGTPYILHALSENGYTSLAYDLLFEEGYPSWLYSVNHGATTMWEHWNGIKEDGSFWSKDMNSFNHYAYGAVFDWMFGVSSGIKPTETAPAYKEIIIAPSPDRRLGFADASIKSRCGFVRSYWRYEGDAVYYEFDIPNGSLARVSLPTGEELTLTGGKHSFIRPTE